PNSVWERMTPELCFGGGRDRRQCETEFRGPAFPNGVWERGRAAQEAAPPGRELFLLLFRDLLNHFIDQTELLGFLSREVAVAVGFNLDLLQGLARVLGEDLVEAMALLHDLGSLNLDIGDLAADLAPGLMDHHLGIGQSIALVLGAG